MCARDIAELVGIEERMIVGLNVVNYLRTHPLEVVAEAFEKAPRLQPDFLQLTSQIKKPLLVNTNRGLGYRFELCRLPR